MNAEAQNTGKRPRLTDSPWFWLYLFSLMGLGAVAAVSPKYARRQQAIENNFQMREHAVERRAAGDTDPDDDYFEPNERVVKSLAPVAFACVTLCVISVAGLIWQRRREPTANPDANPPHEPQSRKGAKESGEDTSG